MKNSVIVVAFVSFACMNSYAMNFKLASQVEREQWTKKTGSLIAFKACIIKDNNRRDQRHLIVIERESFSGQHPIRDRALIRGFLYPLSKENVSIVEQEEILFSDSASELFNAFSNAYIDQEAAKQEELLKQQARERELQKQHLEAIKAHEAAERAAKESTSCYDVYTEQPLDLEP